MTRGYVLLTLGAGPSEKLLAEIRELDGVKRADKVVGSFDVIAEIEAESEQAMLLFVTEEIRSLVAAGRARTCIVRE